MWVEVKVKGKQHVRVIWCGCQVVVALSSRPCSPCEVFTVVKKVPEQRCGDVDSGLGSALVRTEKEGDDGTSLSQAGGSCDQSMPWGEERQVIREGNPRDDKEV